MKPASQSLVFTCTPWSIAAGSVFVVVIAWLSWLAWKRSGYRTATGWLEALRVVMAIGIAITLNQPEWRETFKPESRPTLAILVDSSHSMETRDVIDPVEHSGGAKIARGTAEAPG